MEPNAGADESGLDLGQFHAVFYEEADENLADFETLLLETDVDDVESEHLNAIFRCAHSIKGGAATFGFSDVTSLTHVMEGLLDRLRRGELETTREMIDTLLKAGDALKDMLATHAGESGEVLDPTELVAAIQAHLESDKDPAGGNGSAEDSGPAIVLVLRFNESVPTQAVTDALTMFDEVDGMGKASPTDGVQEVEGIIRSYTIEGASGAGDIVDLLAFHVSSDEIELIELNADGAAEESADESAVEPLGEDDAASEADDMMAAMEQEQDMESRANDETAAKVDGYKAAADDSNNAAAWGLFDEGGAADSASAQKSALANKGPAAKSAAGGKAKSGGNDNGTLRVAVQKVDHLINLVGELVITQTMLEQNGQDLDPIEHQSLVACLAELERNTRLLQESVMSIRMIPMGVVFNRFPRMMRDLESRLGKQIELKTIGEGTELDKGMVEKIVDPLTHLIRNAADHGIESPEQRKAAGKDPVGNITLSAQHKGGQICIEVSDDGNGLSREKLIKKATEKGLHAHDGMSDNDVWALIMEPGFSTADQVTDVSGRGVGMDVVKKNILSLGGSVRIQSAEGFGSTISVNLPLTLAIMDGMSVGIGQNETYILPLASVVESINLQSQQIRTVNGDGRVLKLRGDYIPIIDMGDMLGLDRDFNRDSSDTVVIVEADGKRAALVVDELIGQHQVVVKNLEANYGKIEGVSGATILGDGRVAMILDVSFFVRRARH